MHFVHNPLVQVKTYGACQNTLCLMRPCRPPSVHMGSGFHVIQEQPSFGGSCHTSPIGSCIDQLTISTSSSMLIDDSSSSALFLSFAYVFRQRQRSYIHQDIQFGVIHWTNSSYCIIYCGEQTSMPYPWHHPLLHQDLCPLVQYHD